MMLVVLHGGRLALQHVLDVVHVALARLPEVDPFLGREDACTSLIIRRSAASACLRVMPSLEPTGLTGPSLRLTCRSPTRHFPYHDPFSSTIEPEP